MKSNVITDSNNNVVEDQRPGITQDSLPTTLTWYLEYPSGSTDSQMKLYAFRIRTRRDYRRIAL